MSSYPAEPDHRSCCSPCDQATGEPHGDKAITEVVGRGCADAWAKFGFLRGLFSRRVSQESAPRPVAARDPIAEASLLALRHHAIRPTPEAYTLWYRHLSGERPDLSRRLKDLEARGEPFDAAIIAELFERYFGVQPEAVAIADASRAIEQLLATLASDFAAAEADAAERGARLEHLDATLGGAKDCAVGNDAVLPPRSTTRPLPGTVRRAIASLIEEIRTMRAAAHRLQRRVIESAGEIAQLRATIEASDMAADSCPVTGVATAKTLERALRRCVRQAASGIADTRTPGNAASNPGAAAEDASVADSRPPGAGCCFLIIDLDRFSTVNRSYGRRYGDLVLKTIARHLGLAIKRGDTIGRLDGAAFGIVLAHTDLPGGEALAERLRQSGRSAHRDLAAIPTELGPTAAAPVVTFSIGIAAYHSGEPLHRLVSRADRARQRAKELGGDQVVSERAISVVGRPKA